MVAFRRAGLGVDVALLEDIVLKVTRASHLRAELVGIKAQCRRRGGDAWSRRAPPARAATKHARCAAAMLRARLCGVHFFPCYRYEYILCSLVYT